MTTPLLPAAPAPAGLAELLDRWEREGLLTSEQARLLREDVAAHPEVVEAPAGPRSGSESLLTEALSYLGGVLVLTAGGLLTARLWEDLSYGSRLLLASATTALLLGTGLLVPGRLGAAGQRVRRVLWLLSTAAFAGLLALAGHDGLDLRGSALAVVVTGGTAGYAAGLWWRERSTVQQLALLAACLGFVATAGIELLGDHQSVVPGLAVLVTAALWGLAAQRQLVMPRRTGVVAACAAALLGALVATSGNDDWSQLLAVGVVVAVVVLAVRWSDLLVLAVGAVGALFVLPGAVGHFFPSVVGAAVVLLIAGVSLIAAGLAIASRRTKHDRSA
jgi:hypothetical protein